MVRITGLNRYPIKSLRGCAEAVLEIEPWGPVGDRRWALVEESGEPITARTDSALLAFRARAQTDGSVEVVGPDGRRLRVAVPRREAQIATGFSRVPQATEAGEAARRFFSSALGRPVRLVWQTDPGLRSVNPKNGGLEGEVLSLADAGPLLLASRCSLLQLQDWVGDEPQLAMARFRPNVVIDGSAPFQEDAWPRVRLGEVEFRVQRTCDRCVMTTIDPDTLVKGQEPIRTLARHRSWNGKTWFGVWLVPLSRGMIEVGDEVFPLS